MDQEYTEEQIKELFEKLPADVQEATSSVGVANILQKTGEKYRLHVDKIDELFDETTLVMLGPTHPQDYLANLKRRLQIPDDMARDLVADVNEQIFKPIRESLKKIHGVGEVGSEKLEVGSPSSSNSQSPTSNIQSEAESPALNQADKKILADSGIEIEPPPMPEIAPATEQNTPKKSELLEALENPAIELKESISMPAGFTLIKKSAPEPAAISSPSEKLTGTVKSPSTESAYEAKSLPQKGAVQMMPPKKSEPDPYREPIN